MYQPTPAPAAPVPAADTADLPFDFLALMELAPQADGTLLSMRNEPNGYGAIFGGQMIAQALAAAARSVPQPATAHSLQLQFLAPGRIGEPIRFTVKPLLAGMHFRMLHVTGSQGDRLVLSANVSFHRPEAAPAFSEPMPTGLPDPEGLPTLHELAERHAQRLPPGALQHLADERDVDLRPVDGEAFLFPAGDGTPRLRCWVRMRDALPAEPRLHQAALGYLSDHWLVMTALAPHVACRSGTGLYVASLNHSMWFHQPVRADDWLLLDAETPFSGHGRGLAQGRLFDRAGTLVASVVQEGLFRGWVAQPGEPMRYAAPGPRP